MDFLKQAEQLAASNNTGGANDGTAQSGGGFGNLMNEASSFMNSQQTNTTGSTAAPDQGSSASDGTSATLPDGRQAPTTQELMQSSQLLFGAARGQKVDNQQLAGAAENLLGGLAQHGHLDQGQYGTYINQAEKYLQNYSGQNSNAAAGSQSTDMQTTAGPTSGAVDPNTEANQPSSDSTY